MKGGVGVCIYIYLVKEEPRTDLIILCIAIANDKDDGFVELVS